eukprot:4092048-Pyramimonas_sp.AAC.1
MGKKRCAKAYSECHQNGIDPRTTPVAVDIDAGEKFQVYGVDECKTITRVRGGRGGPWISTYGRRFTTRELLKAPLLRDYPHCPGKADQALWSSATTLN